MAEMVNVYRVLVVDTGTHRHGPVDVETVFFATQAEAKQCIADHLAEWTEATDNVVTANLVAIGVPQGLAGLALVNYLLAARAPHSATFVTYQIRYSLAGGPTICQYTRDENGQTDWQPADLPAPNPRLVQPPALWPVEMPPDWQE